MSENERNFPVLEFLGKKISFIPIQLNIEKNDWKNALFRAESSNSFKMSVLHGVVVPCTKIDRPGHQM